MTIVNMKPDVVFVGGGPVGLWTAIQTKWLTGRNVLVVEKYEEYKRADITLNIAATSLKGIPEEHQTLKNLTTKWGNKAVPIKEMEDELTRCASNMGIRIIKGVTVDPKTVQNQYPNARVIVGSDGARSGMRTEVSGDQYKFNTPLQYLVQVQYIIETPDKVSEDSSLHKIKAQADSYIKQKFAGHLITENTKSLGNGQSKVSLRIFVDKQTYDDMAQATYRTPYYFQEDLSKVPPKIQDTLIKWWGTHNNLKIVKDNENTEKTNKITVIPLASYAAKDVVKVHEDGKVTALVGDASQAFPFFRAINNGFILGTELAKTIGKAFEQKDPKKFGLQFNSYSTYSTYRAYVERIKASFKNLLIVISSFWIKASGNSPFQVSAVTDEEGCYKKGAAIWKELSGEDAPHYVARPTLYSKLVASSIS